MSRDVPDVEFAFRRSSSDKVTSRIAVKMTYKGTVLLCHSVNFLYTSVKSI